MNIGRPFFHGACAHYRLPTRRSTRWPPVRRAGCRRRLRAPGDFPSSPAYIHYANQVLDGKRDASQARKAGGSPTCRDARCLLGGRSWCQGRGLDPRPLGNGPCHVCNDAWARNAPWDRRPCGHPPRCTRKRAGACRCAHAALSRRLWAALGGSSRLTRALGGAQARQPPPASEVTAPAMETLETPVTVAPLLGSPAELA